eukprot:TRINITY_DN16504_c0_g1_i1.p1 TRINITY_DN16504_c0_g1~~TRINITY_DN16504_c0_g1_i1.p1  ORF type:complete len:303 (+),score=49.64 TRINITY_DN16504_c0_g1_i1:69-977(+)
MKARKTYTFSRQRENWTDDEHQKFLEALKLFDRDWKKIETYVGTKTVIQIRSHAQKYFIKVQKNKTGERIPPPRPKRKASHSYHKSTNSSQGDFEFESTKEGLAYDPPFESNSQSNYLHSAFVQRNSNIGAHTENFPSVKQYPLKEINYEKPSAVPHQTSACHSTTKAPSNLSTPNLSKMYSFLASLFDSSPGNHSEILSEMLPEEKEFLKHLMQNLTLNLVNQHVKDKSPSPEHYLSSFQNSTHPMNTDDPAGSTYWQADRYRTMKEEWPQINSETDVSEGNVLQPPINGSWSRPMIKKEL